MSLKRPSARPAGAALAETLREAISHHQAGRTARAERLYREVLKLDPNNVDALHLAGVAAAQRKDYDAAAPLIERAAQLAPHIPTLHLNLGNALRDAGRHEEAVDAFNRALALDPLLADALNNRGTAFRGHGRLALAMDSYQQALALHPKHPEALVNVADLLVDMTGGEEAMRYADEAVLAAPGNHLSWWVKGQALLALGRPAEALEVLDRALALKPDAAEVILVQAEALLDLGRSGEANAAFGRAAKVEPGLAKAMFQRGAPLAAYELHKGALRRFDQAIRLDPTLAEAHSMRAQELVALKRFDEAMAAFDEALRHDPELPHVRNFRLTLIQRICDWQRLEGMAERELAQARRGEVRLAPFVFLSITDDRLEQLAQARRYAAEIFPPIDPPLWRGEAYAHDRIRVAYLSADFQGHATTVLMGGLFAHHDRSRFEVTAISIGGAPEDEVRQRLRKGCERFIQASEMSERDIARMIRDMEIDILVDMKGYTGGMRIGVLARRPAPLQVSWLGYPGTMGAPYIDYIIADAEVVPPGAEDGFSEAVVRLPGSYQVNDRERMIGAPITRASVGLPETGFVFADFNSTYKITPQIFDIWMRLLHKVPGSVLWLLSDIDQASDNLRREAAARGIDPARLIISPFAPGPEHLARNRLADLFLDTVPVNAHTTASDALWAGLPVLTVRTGAFVGRVAASLLKAVGLPELICDDLAAYEALALELATHPERLAALRARLEANRLTCPLFDTEGFARNIEAAFAAMHERRMSGLPPGTIDLTSPG